MDPWLVSLHWVTPLVRGDLRVTTRQLEVCGRMPRPDGPAELGSGPAGLCASLVNPLSDEHSLMARDVFKMPSRCWALFCIWYHEGTSILGQTDSRIDKGNTYGEMVPTLTLEGGGLCA